MTAVAVTASGLPAVIAALEVLRGAPPSPRSVSALAGPEEGRPAPTRMGTGRTHSFEETQPSEEEVNRA